MTWSPGIFQQLDVIFFIFQPRGCDMSVHSHSHYLSCFVTVNGDPQQAQYCHIIFEILFLFFIFLSLTYALAFNCRVVSRLDTQWEICHARTSMRMWAFGWLSSGRPVSEHSVHGWSVWAYHASAGHRLSVSDHLFSLVLFPLPKLSVEASLFDIRRGAKNKTAGEHNCSFGRGNEHLPGLLVLLF